MRNTARLLAAVGMVGAAIAAGPMTAPAEAAPAAARSLYAPSVLVLTIGKGELAATTGVDRAVMLRCAPTAAGDHPVPAQACAALKGVDGDFTALSGDQERACTAIHSPVVVTAEGTWQGRRVSYEESFANGCVMQRETGAVFGF
jgi:Subtilisin inhibitor-like